MPNPALTKGWSTSRGKLLPSLHIPICDGPGNWHDLMASLVLVAFATQTWPLGIPGEFQHHQGGSLSSSSFDAYCIVQLQVVAPTIEQFLYHVWLYLTRFRILTGNASYSKVLGC